MNIVQAEATFVQRMVSKNWAKSTQENYRSQVRLFLHTFRHKDRARNITADEIEQYLNSNPVINTRKHARCAIQAFYQLVVGQPMKLAHIPWPKKEKKLPQPLDVSEVQALIKACDNLKHKAIICLMYGCGLRISEVLNLRIVDIDSKRNVINIIAGKGKKDRQVMLDSLLLDLLRKYYVQYRPKEYLFNGQSSLQYSERSINQFIKKYAALAGINRHVHAHLLRHCFATHSLEQGTDIRLIQRLLGHNSIKTTLIYTHVSTALIANTTSPISKMQFYS